MEKDWFSDSIFTKENGWGEDSRGNVAVKHTRLTPHGRKELRITDISKMKGFEMYAFEIFNNDIPVDKPTYFTREGLEIFMNMSNILLLLKTVDQIGEEGILK